MLDIYARETAGRCALLVRGAEFFRIELAPLADGQILASLTATTVDDCHSACNFGSDAILVQLESRSAD